MDQYLNGEAGKTVQALMLSPKNQQRILDTIKLLLDGLGISSSPWWRRRDGFSQFSTVVTILMKTITAL
jgi:hypothetical protein